jgi:pimeloyl-ACP methyl ester carboxylesterase
MGVDWELQESGPVDAERGVLLLPGGLNSARSYAELMAQPELASVRMVAATLPGHAGTPPPDDLSIENYARLASELAAGLGTNVVVGFSMGGSVALEMVASGAFSGPVVLMGISLSREDEPAFFRAIDHLGGVLGSLPSAAMLKLIGLFTRQARVSAERRAELVADFRKNDPKVMRAGFRAYLQYLGSHKAPAARLCDAGVPAWVVHAEKGDGGLTAEERRTLEGCPSVTLVTLPGTSYLIPNEEPQRIGGVVVEALAAAGG